MYILYHFICVLHTLCIFDFWLEYLFCTPKICNDFFEKFWSKYLEISRFFFNFAVQIKQSLIWMPINSPTYFSHTWFSNT